MTHLRDRCFFLFVKNYTWKRKQLRIFSCTPWCTLRSKFINSLSNLAEILIAHLRKSCICCHQAQNLNPSSFLCSPFRLNWNHYQVYHGRELREYFMCVKIWCENRKSFKRRFFYVYRRRWWRRREYIIYNLCTLDIFEGHYRINWWMKLNIHWDFFPFLSLFPAINIKSSVWKQRNNLSFEMSFIEGFMQHRLFYWHESWRQMSVLILVHSIERWISKYSGWKW